MFRFSKLTGTSGLALIVSLAVPAAANAQSSAATPTFSKDVLPIMQRSCQKCHRPGSNAPMSLLTYQDVRPWVRAIKTRVAARQMPPWHIDRSIGEYVGDPSLSDREIATVAAWIDNGASTSIALTGLDAGTTYYWHVQAVNVDGATYSDSGETAFWSFTTVPDPPGAFGKTSPTNGAVEQSLTPTLDWAASAGATSYEYCYDTTNAASCSNWTDNGNSTSKALIGLSTDTTYYWHVRAVNSGGTTYSDSGAITHRRTLTHRQPCGLDSLAVVLLAGSSFEMQPTPRMLGPVPTTNRWIPYTESRWHIALSLVREFVSSPPRIAQPLPRILTG